MIKKETVIQGLQTLAEMGNLWHNGRYPSSSFKSSTTEIENILKELLELKNIYINEEIQEDLETPSECTCGYYKE